jgi:N-acetylglucosamine kinase-like BadF-type ATPase
MILIADSGSTKTSWRLLQPDGYTLQAKTVGMNPYYQDTPSIVGILEELFDNQLYPQIQSKQEIHEVYFYGAGCATPERCQIVAKGLEIVFPNATIEVQSDVLGAARALCGEEAGIACILGTGSGATRYDGKNIVQSAISLGFWLGDEGSGGYLGKKIVTDFLNGEMPADLASLFHKRYALNREIILENINKPFPNRYFASFSKFLFDHLTEPYCYEIVYQSFSLFFERRVCKFEDYHKYKIHFTGSVAFYYANVLRQVANDKGITLKNIMEEPVAGLVLYHQKY